MTSILAYAAKSGRLTQTTMNSDLFINFNQETQLVRTSS